MCRAFITSPFVSDVGVNGRVLIRLDERVVDDSIHYENGWYLSIPCVAQQTAIGVRPAWSDSLVIRCWPKDVVVNLRPVLLLNKQMVDRRSGVDRRCDEVRPPAKRVRGTWRDHLLPGTLIDENTIANDRVVRLLRQRRFIEAIVVGEIHRCDGFSRDLYVVYEPLQLRLGKCAQVREYDADFHGIRRANQQAPVRWSDDLALYDRGWSAGQTVGTSGAGTIQR